MDIITTHTHADFDSLAAMVAARKLYPEAEMVFSGSQRKNVRDYLSQEFRNIYAFKKIRHINPEKIKRLIVVDVRQSERLGRLAECLHNPGLVLHVYDRHADGPADLRGNLEYIQPFGATTTIFVHLFQERGILPGRDECTLMAMGIYENTKSFMSAATRPEDLAAASWLLAQGANLDIVNQFVSHELSSSQINFLTQLRRQASTRSINGIQVMLSQMVPVGYIGYFEAIVQQIMAVENIDAFIALLNMGGRVHLVARSRVPELNAGTIAREFGGGGHASAASATIHNLPIEEVEEQLIGLLHQHIRPKALAVDLMTAPVIAVTPNLSIAQANQLMTRYNITALPVARGLGNLEEGTPPRGFLGAISRAVAEKAIFHQLGDVPVMDYMNSEIVTLPEGGTLADIQNLIVDNRQRIIPVVRGEDIVGVITRTDLFNLMVSDPHNLSPELLREDERPSVEQGRLLLGLMLRMLSRETMVLLRRIGEAAQRMHYQAYVAGGFVRDLLLQVKNMDIDIVIEGDGLRFAQELARDFDAVVYPHEKFGTAMLILPDQSRIDVATARLEYYDYPAAMPTVELSSIKLDLYRRDFTVNAMAIHLNPKRFGTLTDYFHGQNDLKERRIQVLHNLSFVEDPTRIFRAIRFEARLDFRITPHTEKLIQNTVQMSLFDRVSEPRFFHELKLILAEEDPIPALLRMASFHLFPFLWPGLRTQLTVNRRFLHMLNQTRLALSWFAREFPQEKVEGWMVYLLIVLARAPVESLESFCIRFDIPPKQRRKLTSQKIDAEKIHHNMLTRQALKPSEVYWLLESLENEGQLYLMGIARKRSIIESMMQYRQQLCRVKPLLGGRDLKSLGYKPGPHFRLMLNHLLEMQLDGAIHSKEEGTSFLLATYPPDSSSVQNHT